MTGSAKSFSESDESPTAVINVSATTPTTTAQVHRIANRENREKRGATCVMLHVIHVKAVPSDAIGS